MQALFLIYADFESNLNQVQKPNRDNPDISYIDKYQGHITFSYGCKVACIDDRFSKPVLVYRGKKNEINFQNICYICNKLYTEKDIRVRDHCHITGKYRSSAHLICNTNFG